MPQRIVFSMLVLAALCVSTAQANVIIYATKPAPNAGPSNLDASELPNTDSFFDIFVKTDVPVVGLSLDVLMTGQAATLTSVLVQNPKNGANDRWTAIFPGVVNPAGSEAISADGYALAPATGMNPASSLNDLGFDPVAGAYHYARVNYHTSDIAGAVSNIRLRVGGNDIGIDNDPSVGSPIFLGVSPAGGPTEGPACQTAAFDCVGAVGTADDGRIQVLIPEPASISLIGLALLGLVGFVRRHR